MTKDKTCTELKFENREIASLKVDDLEFSFIDKNGNIKHKDRLHIPFSNLSGSLKGLKLRVFKNSGNKIFVLNYWFQGKSVYYTIGQYIPDTFGTEEVEDKLLPIVRSHKDKTNGSKIQKKHIVRKEQI